MCAVVIPTEESFHELSDIGSESILGHKRSAYRAEYHVASRLLRRLVQIHVYFVIFLTWWSSRFHVLRLSQQLMAHVYGALVQCLKPLQKTLSNPKLSNPTPPALHCE